MDITGAALGLLFLSPLFFVISILIKATSPGPVFFKQQRAGIGRTTFDIYKFRTMHDGAERVRDDLLALNERIGPVFKITNDPRITPLGKFLRQWSLDELPQLFNVLKGDMSLVGPRPLYVVEEHAISRWHRIRREVKPGITCLWQISKRDDDNFDNWVRLDIQYIRGRSFWMDVKILFLTIPAVLSKKGAK